MIGVREVAAQVGVSEQAVRKALAQGRLKGIYQGNAWQISEEDAQAWATARRGVLAPIRPNAATRPTLPYRGAPVSPDRGVPSEAVAHLLAANRALLDAIEALAGASPDVAPPTSWGSETGRVAGQ